MRAMEGHITESITGRTGPPAHLRCFLRLDDVHEVWHCLTNIAEVGGPSCLSVSEGRTEAVLEVCAVFENLRRKPLTDEYNVQCR